MSIDKKISRREVVKKVGSIPVLALVAPPLSGNLPSNLTSLESNSHEKTQQAEEKIFLNKVSILVDPDEPTYVQHALEDLRDFLQEQTASSVEILSSLSGKTEVVIAAGRKAALQLLPDEVSLESLPDAGFQIRSVRKNGQDTIAVSGKTAEGTNYGLASLMNRIRLEGKSAYLKSPLNITTSPKFRMRGIHLNGWPLNNPYSFRTWEEKDWQHFIDMAWLQRANLFFLWPFMEIMPLPLAPEDEAYLQEVRRVVDYAQKRRGMKVWIMQSANRIAVSNCGVRDTKSRLYWVDSCQKDMNPADPEQVKRIMQSFETLYRALDNADGFCMIDSDPGGWPQSPIADQVKIFQGARKLLDEYSLQGKKCELIDWMWVGWGRHKFYSPSKTVVAQYDWSSQNPDASDLAFMEGTIRNFKQNLEEPWSLIAGFSPYLKSCRNEKVLEKTIYLPYGAIEVEPAFPNTRVNLGSVRNALEAVRDIPEIRGIMGNNQTPLLQLPRTFFFLNSAWDFEFRKRGEAEVMGELAEQLYPKHKELITDCFQALGDTRLDRIEPALNHLQNLLGQGNSDHSASWDGSSILTISSLLGVSSFNSRFVLRDNV
ncbi:MAG: hypothetical protein U0V70_19060 [Terriglobia bacterium]